MHFCDNFLGYLRIIPIKERKKLFFLPAKVQKKEIAQPKVCIPEALTMCVRNQLNTAQHARVVGSSQAAKNTKTTVFFGFELAYNLNTDLDLGYLLTHSEILNTFFNSAKIISLVVICIIILTR